MAIVASTATAAERASDAPIVRIADASTLKSIIHFGSLDPNLHINRRGDYWWRAEVSLPRRTSLKEVRVTGYDPIFLLLSDDRCFKIQLDGDRGKLTRTDVTLADCPSGPDAHRESPWPAPVPRSGERYIGRGWDIDAWADGRTGQTILVDSKHQGATPLLMTDMKVVGLGGLGSPDAPMTEVTLIGYVRGQLTLATVMIFEP